MHDMIQGVSGSQEPAPEEKIGIFISMFPERHETFILRELVALEQRGVDFTIFSLQFPREDIAIEEARRLSQERTVYGSLISISSLTAFFGIFLQHPLTMIRVIGRVLWQVGTNP